MLRLSKKPEAIFCCDDYIALGSMKAIGELGLRFPDDLAIAGFDNADISPHTFIELTTVSQGVTKMGSLASKLLIDQIEGKAESKKRIMLKPQLIIRESCGYKLASHEKDYQQAIH